MSGPLSQAGLGHLAMLLFSALVAGSFSLGALAVPEIDPRAFTALRFGLAAAMMVAVVRLTMGPGRLKVRAPGRFAVLGALYAGYFVGMFYALETAAPVSIAAVFTLTPLMSAIAGWFLLRQQTTPRMAAALAVGAAGALWVIFRADLAALLAFAVGRGETIFFFACIAHAIYTPVVRMVNRGEPVLPFTALVLVFAFVILLPFSAGPILATDWTGLSWIVWAALLYIALFATMGSSFLLAFASLRLPSAKVMAYTYLIPAWVILWEIALGAGAPAPLVMGGVALTMVALWLLLKDEEAPKPASA